MSYRTVFIKILRSIFLPALMLAGGLLPILRADTLAEKTLRDIVQRQKDVFSKADAEGENLDEARFRAEAQSIASSYDILIQKTPDFAPAYVAYGVFLGRIGMVKEAVGILLKANQLEANIPIVKNQLAKHLAEDGKPLDALPWIMSAIDLEPKESLYHFQLGTLLREGRDEFIRSGDFTRPALDRAMLQAFQRASELDAGNIPYAYRHAEAYYDLEEPKWDEALSAWQQLGLRVSPGLERQTTLLHEAKVLVEKGDLAGARALLDGVTKMPLAAQKNALLEQIHPAEEKRDAPAK